MGMIEAVAETVTARKKRLEAERKARRAAEGVRPEPVKATPVSEHAAQHGDYETYNGRTVNHGGTPIARWIREDLLSETQQAAIRHCLRLWELAGRNPRVTANLDRTVFGVHGDGDPREIDARHDLHRIQDGFPFQYWQVFENVCRHDEPAGVAGSRLMSDTRSAASHARLIVCMVADMIAMRERLSY